MAENGLVAHKPNLIFLSVTILFLLHNIRLSQFNAVPRAFNVAQIPVRYMGVYFCRPAGLVTQKLLNVPQVRAIFQQVGSKGVSQTMEIKLRGYTRTFERPFPDFLHAAT